MPGTVAQQCETRQSHAHGWYEQEVKLQEDVADARIAPLITVEHG